MTAHTVTSYDDDLKSLDAKILHMGGLAEHQLQTALPAVTSANPELATQVVAADPQIDAAQREIEEWRCAIIARRQPVAIDLRAVVGAMRVAVGLERIGDMAKSIGKRIAKFDETAWLSPMTRKFRRHGRFGADSVEGGARQLFSARRGFGPQGVASRTKRSTICIPRCSGSF